MRTTKILSLLLVTAFVFLLSSCEPDHYGCTDSRAGNYDSSADIDDGSCEYNSERIYVGNCTPSESGNLIIRNQTGEELYLYKNEAGSSDNNTVLITCIPSDTADFLVNIPNEDLSVCLLQIWKVSDVEGTTGSPDINTVHRQWSIALSNSMAPEERANWLITGSDEVAGTGTLLITYPDVDDYGQAVIYQVDILLNSKSGAKLASLQPGIVNKKVSVDYGVQYLYHHYWYSDPNSTSGEIQEIGWAETPDIVINDFHNEASIEIPVHLSNIGKFGELTVINENDFVVNVYVNDVLIEDLAVVEGSPQGLSSVPAKSQTTFIIPVEKYNITTKTLAGIDADDFKDIQIVQNEIVILRSGVLKKTIRITNNTDELLGLFSINSEFLGLIIEPGKLSPQFTIPDQYDTLLVVNFARTQSKGFKYNSSITISELDEYNPNRVELTNVWPVTDDIYQSPKIEDNTETIMEGSLITSESVVLTFEYNVSSEEGYDKFTFYANGFVELNDVSGETGWVTFSKSFGPGTHELIWKYEKDQTRFEGNDNVQIRSISIN